MPQKRTRQTTTRRRAAAPTARPGATPTSRRSTQHRATRGAGSARPQAVTPRTVEPAGVTINLPGAGEVLLTRRHFLYGMAGLAAAAALGGGGYAYSQFAANNDGDVPTLKVPTSAVFTTDDCTEMEDAATAMVVSAQIELPYGSLVWSSDDTIAACLLPTETSKPLAQIGILSLTGGTCSTVVENAVGEDDGFEIYDVRACPNGIIWAEADILEGLWRIYAATLTDLTVGTPQLVDQGNSDWEMPTLAVAGSYAFWQMVPKADGPADGERCKVKRAKFGSSDAEEVYTSKGRIPCAPYSANDCVVIVARAEVSGTYYQLTRINAESGEADEALVLPASMKPFEVGYGSTGFCFAFDGIYNYGDGIANLGTYVPAQDPRDTPVQLTNEVEQINDKNAGIEAVMKRAAHESQLTYGAVNWFRFPRTPGTSPCWCGDWFMVKSTKAIAGINLNSRQFFALEVENGTEDYGEFLASTGERKRIVGFSNIDHKPLSGDTIHQCLVKVYEAI